MCCTKGHETIDWACSITDGLKLAFEVMSHFVVSTFHQCIPVHGSEFGSALVVMVGAVSSSGGGGGGGRGGRGRSRSISSISSIY